MHEKVDANHKAPDPAEVITADAQGAKAVRDDVLRWCELRFKDKLEWAKQWIDVCVTGFLDFFALAGTLKCSSCSFDNAKGGRFWIAEARTK